MPSIIFHLTEAKLITQHLREASADYPFTHIHGWQNDFTIGCFYGRRIFFGPDTDFGLQIFG